MERPPRPVSMAAVPLETLFTGAALDVVNCGDRPARPHQALGHSNASRSPATCCTCERCLWDGLATVSAQESREMLPRSSLQEGFPSAPRGLTGNDLQRALRASARTRVRGD